MTKPYITFDEYMIRELQDPAEAESFLTIVLEEYEKDPDPAVLMRALRLVAEAQGGVGALSKRTKLNRQNLYKVLTGKTTPTLATTLSIMKGLGYRLRPEPLDPR